MSMLSNFELRLADAEDMDTVYKIRYKAYLRAGLIASNPSEQFSDIYDFSDSATTFVISHGRKVIGTVRYVTDSKIGLPMDDEGLGPFLTTLRQTGRHIVEAGRLAILPGYQSMTRDLSLHLCIYTISNALLTEKDDMVIMVSKHHHKFYERVFMFETIASDHHTSYSPNTFSLRLNLKQLMQRYVCNRTARRFGLPDHLKSYQEKLLRDTRNLSRHVCH